MPGKKKSTPKPASPKKNPAKQPPAPPPPPPPASPAEGAAPAPLSALAAAAKVLAETDRPLSCPELIAAMAAQGYWTSPKGRTPAATLNAALLREIKTKGEKSRFRKTGRGTFALAQAT